MTTRKSGTQDVTDLYKAETQNFLANLEDAEHAMSLFDKLYELFEKAGPMFLKATGKKTDDPLALSIQTNLYQLMKLDLLRGIVSLTRGYITDSSFHTRRLLETSAVMIELFRKQKKVGIYASLETTEEQKEYIDNFRIFRLVETNLSEASQKHYELLCFQVHPSAIAVGDRAKITEERVHELKAFDVNSDEDTPRLMKWYGLHMLMTFEGIRGLKKAFSETELDTVAWDNGCAEFKSAWDSDRKSVV